MQWIVPAAIDSEVDVTPREWVVLRNPFPDAALGGVPAYRARVLRGETVLYDAFLQSWQSASPDIRWSDDLTIEYIAYDWQGEGSLGSIQSAARRPRVCSHELAAFLRPQALRSRLPRRRALVGERAARHPVQLQRARMGVTGMGASVCTKPDVCALRA